MLNPIAILPVKSTSAVGVIDVEEAVLDSTEKFGTHGLVSLRQIPAVVVA
jgi:hypothetical protein